jgi:GxxExxY protein
MTENQLATIILDKCFIIHKTLGPGLLESVYEEILVYELRKEGLNVKQQEGFGLEWDGVKMPLAFRADVIVEDKVIIELKATNKMNESFKKTLLTYLKITNKKLGLLINFNEALLKDGITRIVNGLY